MTLTKAIEAARGFILESYASKGACGCHSSSLPNGGVKCSIHKAIAALPDKPMTEKDIVLLIAPYHCGNYTEALAIIRALKAANVLYVKE